MSSNRSLPAQTSFASAALASRRVLGTRTALGTLAALGALWSPASVWAITQQLGTAGGAPAVPNCPSLPCQALTRTTGFQAAVGGSHNAMVVSHAGRVTSWTITLAKPNPDEISFFDKLAGGPPEAALVTLRQGSNYRFRVIGATPTVALTQLFGTTKVFTLAQPLAVGPGDVIGLSVPTWAPALELGQANETAWRASRAHRNCADVTTPTFEIRPGGIGQFECVYRNGRLTYGATVNQTTPAVPKPRRSGVFAPLAGVGGVRDGAGLEIGGVDLVPGLL